MNRSGQPTLFDAALIVGAPLLLAVVELFHPHADDLLSLDVQTWLAVHYAQIALFPLTALAVTWLIRSRTGVAAAICRLAMFIFGVSWTAWDTVAGVATGLLVNSAHASDAPEAWRAAIGAIWTDPLMGGLSGLFALLGALALSIGVVAAAVSLRQEGRSWGPLLVLALSSFGIAIFRTHAWPGGPLTFGGIALAGAWLLRERAREAQDRTERSSQVVTVENASGSH